MNKILPIILISLLGTSSSALEVVYPKKENVTINSPSTFFVGNAKSSLKINDEEVEVNANSGFAKQVKLEYGDNKFILQDNENSVEYNIFRPEPLYNEIQNFKPEYIEYDAITLFKVSFDGAPLRETPIDGGINRMSHLQKGISLPVIGEKNGFYKVVLGENDYGWILKTHVIETEEEFSSAKLISQSFDENEKFYTFKFEFDKQIPYTVEETDKLVLNFYNLEDEKGSTLKIETPCVKQIYGYSTKFDGNLFILKVKKAPQKPVTITIDAGHGGSELGAIGCLGTKEKDVNLAISKELEKELKSRGITPLMTRNDDRAISLKDRVKFAEQNNSNILISIHANALPDNNDPMKHSGTSVYYYYPQAKPLAKEVLESINTQAYTANGGVHQQSLALVRTTSCPAILVEVGYMINPNDNGLLINTDFQKSCAKAIADGIEKFLEIK